MTQKKKNPKKIITFSIVFILILTVFLYIIFCFPLSPKRIFDNSVRSIVELKAESSDVGESYGTAEFVDKNGTLVTNAHVVTYTRLGKINTFNRYSIRFAAEDEYRQVELLKYDLENDLALLRLADLSVSFKALKTGDSQNLSFGDRVYAIGNASNYGLSVTQGIVSIPKVHVEHEKRTREVIQCDLTISAGNSGGALLDERGRLIGITTFRLKDGAGNIVYGLAYCIPVHIIMKFIAS